MSLGLIPPSPQRRKNIFLFHVYIYTGEREEIYLIKHIQDFQNAGGMKGSRRDDTDKSLQMCLNIPVSKIGEVTAVHSETD